MLKINKKIIFEKIDNKITVFDAEKSLLYTFNETATYIFGKLKAKWDKDRIIEAMLKRYPIKKEQAEKDLSSLIKELKTRKVLIDSPKTGVNNKRIEKHQEPKKNKTRRQPK